MVIQTSKNRIRLFHITSSVFIGAYLFVTVAFFLSQLVEASREPLTGDQQYAFEASIRPQEYLSMLVLGARGQASAAPLDYIVCKVLDDIKDDVSYFGLHPKVYFRLFANGATTFCAVLILFLFGKEIARQQENLALAVAQWVLLLCVPLTSFFAIQVYKFAHLMRPYALWTSLYFLALAVSIRQTKRNRLLLIILILLAFTATGSVFQLSAMVLAYLVVAAIQKDKLKDVILNGTKLFGLPFAVVLYYCFQVGKFGYDPPLWMDFYKYWSHHLLIIPLMVGASVACFLNKSDRPSAMAPLSLLFVYLLGPIIFMLTRSRGLFYADRYYMYYELCRAIFLLTIVKCLPDFINKVKSQRVVVVVLLLTCFVGSSFALRPKILRRFQKSIAEAGWVIAGNLQTVS